MRVADLTVLKNLSSIGFLSPIALLGSPISIRPVHSLSPGRRLTLFIFAKFLEHCHMIIRNASVDDLNGLYQVCLKTGDSGNDATHLYRNPHLLGEIYVGPYVQFNSESSFALIDESGMISGYSLSTVDTLTFQATCAKEWWPAKQSKYVEPSESAKDEWTLDNHLEYEIYHPTPSPIEVLELYPSHGHIDLLPHMQGKGWGRKMMDAIDQALIQAGSPGMHLRVSNVNYRALGFYAKLGYPEIMRRGNEVIVGKRYA